MTRLENNVDSKTLYKIGELFVEQYVKSFTKPPRHVILDADDTNANTYANTYKGTNIRFVVTKNRNNSPETIYKRYCKRGEMELWIKDIKYFKADRMSCHRELHNGQLYKTHHAQCCIHCGKEDIHTR